MVREIDEQDNSRVIGQKDLFFRQGCDTDAVSVERLRRSSFRLIAEYFLRGHDTQRVNETQRANEIPGVFR